MPILIDWKLKKSPLLFCYDRRNFLLCSWISTNGVFFIFALFMGSFCRAHGDIEQSFCSIGTDETTRPRMLSLLHPCMGSDLLFQQFYSFVFSSLQNANWFSFFLGLITRSFSVMFLALVRSKKFATVSSQVENPIGSNSISPSFACFYNVFLRGWRSFVFMWMVTFFKK